MCRSIRTLLSWNQDHCTNDIEVKLRANQVQTKHDEITQQKNKQMQSMLWSNIIMFTGGWNLPLKRPSVFKNIAGELTLLVQIWNSPTLNSLVVKNTIVFLTLFTVTWLFIGTHYSRITCTLPSLTIHFTEITFHSSKLYVVCIISPQLTNQWSHKTIE